jgi:hypothetical protein
LDGRKIFSKKTEVSIIICHDFKPWRNNTKLIVDSIKNINEFVYTSKVCEIFICLDYLRPEYNLNSAIRLKYKKFIGKLNSKGIKVFNLDQWGHLSTALTNTLQHVDSKYLFVCQADLLFVRKVQLDEVLEFICESNACVRFNRRTNIEKGWDTELSLFVFKKLNFLTTPSWSDNNHVCLTSYYKSLIIPIIRDKQDFPESIIRENNLHKMYKLKNNFIFGKYGEDRYITHLGESDRFSNKVFKKTGSVFLAQFFFFLHNYFVKN